MRNLELFIPPKLSSLAMSCVAAGSVLFLAACGDSGLEGSYDAEVAPPPAFTSADRIRITGSSTVAPFSTTVAEQFGATTQFSTPIVEVTGTSTGFKAFCLGVGPSEPSVSNASRPIKMSEVELCASNGVTELVEVKIGYDGIVLANSIIGPDYDITKEEIYRAIASELPDGAGGWVDNPNKLWSDVNPSFPDVEIKIYGPPPSSGTRDAFVEIAMEGGAGKIPQLAALKKSNKGEFKRRAHEIRTDGVWIDAGENDTVIVQDMIKNPNTIGVLGFSFLDQNGDRIKGAKVSGIPPEFDNIVAGDYGISRSLFFYLKAQNVSVVPGLEAFIDVFTQEGTWGPEGYLAEKGLIPLKDDERQLVRERAMKLKLLQPEDVK